MAKDLADLTVSDVTGFPLTVTLKVQDADANVPGVIGGTLQVPGMAAQSDGSFELTGTAEQINALLAQASFTAHATGQAYIQLTVSNPQSMQASTGIYALTSVTEPVNQAPSFAPPTGTGKLIVSISGSMDYGRSLALLPDGKLVLAGYSYIGTQNYISLIRLNTDGTLDSSFSADGKLLLPSDAGKSNGIYGMGLQPDGKMVLIGNTNGGKSDGTYFLMRLGADGTVDTDFNGTGTHYINIGNGEDGGHAVAIQPDGKILAAGTSVRNGNYDFSLARLNADGSLDTSFGTDGTVVVPVGSYRDLGLGVTLQPDGKIIMVGTAQTVNGAIWNFGIIRLNPDGSLDSSFNGAGKQQVSFGGTSDDAWNVAVQADGKIVVSGLSGGEFGIARLNADGSMDASFGAGGKQYFYVGGGEAESHSLILQPDGKIVMAGMARNGSNSLDFALMRLNPNGSPDTSFNANGPVPGQLLARVGNDADLGYSAVLQPDGKIVVAGYSSHGGTTQFSLIRVNPNGTLDATFNPSASPVDTLAGSAASYDQTGTPAVLDADAAIFDPELAAQGHYSGASITLARVGGAVAEDEFGASGNLSLSNGRAMLHGTDIGSYVQAHGSFTLTLNASATQSRVNEALQSLTYRNTGGNPPLSVDIEWTFNDGNTADAQGRGGALSAAGRTTVSIAPANQPPTGAITITGTAMQGQTLAADTSTLADADGLGALNYQWLRDGLAIAGATANTYTLTQDDVGFAISLRVSYSDGRGTQETVASASTGAVLPPPANNPPTGVPVITGTAMQGQTLTGDTSTLADADGLGAFNYQWLRDGLAIAGATANTYTLTQDDVGFAISLRVSYSDGRGTQETVASASTGTVVPPPANNPPTGVPVITGTAMQGQTLTADTSTLADADGLGAFNYQWLRDGLAIAGATANTYTLAQDDVGFAISLRVSYSDGRGTQETVASASTGAVLPPPANNPPTGLPVITGPAMQGQTLMADTSTLADADGLGALNYQWLRDGLAIAGATANTYTLTQDDVGFAISLCVSYSDGAGYPEKVLSATTARVEAAQEQPPIVPPNQAPLLLDLPSEIQEVEVGIAAALADWRVVDPDAPHEPLILVLTPVNGHIGGLESASATGIDAIWTQNAWVLQGPALAMNKLLAGLTFTADSPGEAAIEIRLSDGRSPAPVSARYTFRSQDDADGITAAQESGVPGLPGPGGVPALPGDGNGDGILDSRQKEVVSAPFAQSPYGGSAPGDAPRTYVTLVAGEGRSVDTASQITGLRQLDSPPGLPGLMELPLGMLAFSLQMDATGGTHRFSLYLDAAQPVNGYWAQNHDGVWTHLASAAFGGRMVIEGDRLRLDFQITDGGEFDADGQLNGVITHQGAAGRLPLSLVGYAPDTEHMLLWF